MLGSPKGHTPCGADSGWASCGAGGSSGHVTTTSRRLLRCRMRMGTRMRMVSSSKIT
jgi:hypothetical protein